MTLPEFVRLLNTAPITENRRFDYVSIDVSVTNFYPNGFLYLTAWKKGSTQRGIDAAMFVPLSGGIWEGLDILRGEMIRSVDWMKDQYREYLLS